MSEFLSVYWPHILATVSVVLGAAAAIHATMTKEDVRSAAGWVGVILLSPLVGALIYFVAGINRIRRRALVVRRIMGSTHPHLSGPGAARRDLPEPVRLSDELVGLKLLGDSVAGFPLTSGNSIEILDDGDRAYAAMSGAIDAAKRHILMETYIFDNDEIGVKFADRLIAAVARGVVVRVLIDAVGARYSVPSIVGHLRAGGVKVESFNGRIITGLRLPYANLRTHRKILIIDDELAFTGGMNVREAFSAEITGEDHQKDTHFRLTGPVVADLHAVAVEDWRFARGQESPMPAYSERRFDDPSHPVAMRVVASGPDLTMATNQKILMGAFSVARRSIRIMSPYFLPDRELIAALVTAARRGIAVDIVVPRQNNLLLVDLAMTAQFDQILVPNCRIWRADGAFNHSKLMAVDGNWAFVGSSNLDPRSLRLNFEVDLEIFDPDFAADIEKRIDNAIQLATQVDLRALQRRPFLLRLVEKILWLGSPFL